MHHPHTKLVGDVFPDGSAKKDLIRAERPCQRGESDLVGKEDLAERGRLAQRERVRGRGGMERDRHRNGGGMERDTADREQREDRRERERACKRQDIRRAKHGTEPKSLLRATERLRQTDRSRERIGNAPRVQQERPSVGRLPPQHRYAICRSADAVTL